jgi:sarcosine oxidase gamma subunit
VPLREHPVRQRAQHARAAQAEREREAARIAAASAEGETKGLHKALAEARRPWWRRWLGP